MKKNNIIFKTDSYKFGGHWNMLQPNTTKIYSYLESRGGKFPKSIFFGLQYYLKEYLQGTVVTKEMVEEGRQFSKLHLGNEDAFNYDGWMYIVEKHNGKLPLEIKAPAEGLLIPVSNVLLTVENTDDNCGWLTNYFESLLMKVWETITVSTNGFYLKLLLKKYFEETAEDTNIDFKMHDFGYRSVTSEEQAGLAGMSHLLNFSGTDNIMGIMFADEYYKSGVCGYSIPATEHSIATSFGRNEVEYVKSMLLKYPTGLLSLVADSYNVYEFAKMLSTNEEIKNLILNRDGCTVIRPDSGDPVEVNSKLLNILWNGFGGEYNSKGFKVICDKIRIIQGDGINFESTRDILEMMKANHYSSENLVFGSGSALLNKNFDRDTNNFAFKSSFQIINGVETFVQKDPITSSGKKSKKGKLKLAPGMNGNFMTHSSAETDDINFNADVDTLRTVFLNGDILVETTFDEVRKRVNEYIEIEYKKSLKELEHVD